MDLAFYPQLQLCLFIFLPGPQTCLPVPVRWIESIVPGRLAKRRRRTENIHFIAFMCAARLSESLFRRWRRRRRWSIFLFAGLRYKASSTEWEYNIITDRLLSLLFRKSSLLLLSQKIPLLLPTKTSWIHSVRQKTLNRSSVPVVVVEYNIMPCRSQTLKVLLIIHSHFGFWWMSDSVSVGWLMVDRMESNRPKVKTQEPLCW